MEILRLLKNVAIFIKLKLILKSNRRTETKTAYKLHIHMLLTELKKQRPKKWLEAEKAITVPTSISGPSTSAQ